MALQVAVCGPGDCTEREWDHAWETGRLLAAVVVCGGLGGVMSEAAAGARTGRGTVVGVVPAGGIVHAADPAAAVEATGLFGR